MRTLGLPQFSLIRAPRGIGAYTPNHWALENRAFWAISLTMAVLPLWLLFLGSAPRRPGEEEEQGATLPREKVPALLDVSPRALPAPPKTNRAPPPLYSLS